MITPDDNDLINQDDFLDHDDNNEDFSSADAANFNQQQYEEGAIRRGDNEEENDAEADELKQED